MKKMLMVASVASMIDQFTMPNIQALKKMGFAVHVAANFENGNTSSESKLNQFKKQLKDLGVEFFQIDFSRKVLKFNSNFNAYKQLNKILSNNEYNFIHCHSPIGGVIGRIVAKKNNIPVIYTAHGFHFFKGAPLQNWMLYYPIEKFLANQTHTIVTINKEDYTIASDKFKSDKIKWVPGVGIDLGKIEDVKIEKTNKRKELGISIEDFLIISVGELNKNKNHEVIIRAIAV